MRNAKPVLWFAAAITLMVTLDGAFQPVLAQPGCCDVRGNCDCSADGNVDISDVTRLIDYLFISLYPLCCYESGNTDGSPDGNVDIADVTRIIDNLFIGFNPMESCGDGVISDSLRLAVIRKITPVFDSLLVHSSSFRQDLNNFLSTIPQFEATGIDDESGSVWARFTDGVLYIGTDNKPGASEAKEQALIQKALNSRTVPSQPKTFDRRNYSKNAPGSASTKTAGTGLPLSTEVASLYAVGPKFAPVNGLIESMLQNNGYHVSKRDASVNGLKTIGGEGVVYFSTHGGTGMFSPTEFGYSLWTSSKVDPNNVASVAPYLTDLLAHRLAIQQAVYGYFNGDTTSEVHMGITDKFISYYWGNLSENSLVFMDACSSTGIGAAGVRSAVFGKNGSVYMGWSHTVDASASNLIAKFMFDRLLGANAITPKEDPKQRPFDYISVFSDLLKRGLLIHPCPDTLFANTEFQYVAGGSNFGILAPSIAFMSVFEPLDELSITGIFGMNVGPDARIMVNGTSAPVTNWTDNYVTCTIPRTGAGSEGTVTVEIMGDGSSVYRKSNGVNLSSWIIPFNYEHKENDATITTDITLHIRGDIHAHREVIHEPPVNLVAVPFQHALDSYGTLSASGTSTSCGDGCCITTTWSGIGDMEVPELVTGATIFSAYGGFNPLSHTMNMFLNQGSTYDIINTHVCSTCFPPEFPCLVDDQLNWRSELTLNEHFGPPYFTMYMDDDYSIIAGERTPSGSPQAESYTLQFSGPPTIKLKWEATTAQYPPDSTAAR